jgi:hypothetical protein
MTRTNRFAAAGRPFLIVSAIAVALLATDQLVHRAVEIPAPAGADSLAGVIARLFPGRADSAAVARVRWYQSPRRWLSWTQGEQYNYRDEQLSGAVVTAAEADLRRFSITFAQREAVPEIVKHELGHLLLHEAKHPADVFARLEAYRGR